MSSPFFFSFWPTDCHYHTYSTKQTNPFCSLIFIYSIPSLLTTLTLTLEAITLSYLLLIVTSCQSSLFPDNFKCLKQCHFREKQINHISVLMSSLMTFHFPNLNFIKVVSKAFKNMSLPMYAATSPPPFPYLSLLESWSTILIWQTYHILPSCDSLASAEIAWP